MLAKFKVDIDLDKCTKCRRCAVNCTYDCIKWDKDEKKPYVSKDSNCVACQRCTVFCPVDAITVRNHPGTYSPHANWTTYYHRVIYENARTGRVLLTGMGCDQPKPSVFDNLVWDACQVTNPAIDALREPVETVTFLGKKIDRLDVKDMKKGYEVEDIPPNVRMSMPLFIGHMSLGSLSYNAYISMIRAAEKVGTLMGTGEGGLHVSLRPYKANIVSEVASGRFGVGPDYLDVAALEIKIGQGAKPGHGGQLPGEKVNEMIADTRGIPEGTDALSPNPQHDIYSIEDLKTLIAALHEATDYKVPVGVKIAAVNNAPAIASGIVHANADFITIDGLRGGTGAAPRVVRDNTGIPIELAVAATDRHLTRQGIRHKVTLVAGGSLRSSADLVKMLALGADCGMISTSVLMAMGCTVCQQCHRGQCSWGIATGRPDLGKRVDVEWATQRVVNLFNAWHAELEEVLGIMGIDAVESFIGNRGRLRYIGPNPHEAQILGVKHAGE
ncbi:MAG: FMN-binding glutamate synthase family protein [Candidatus Altiarchaeales archaeon]|nr:FMN-binding glutamate synthase family protein [Candidatus Altiarchaeales archaeon]MBD3416101.1 FMN-binding glutamate synthase family protein [Candidatus Altiarchaeales archaeon]